ncbi:MAG: glycosyltransferase [Gemmatimonadales bacterium]|jgi:glycosyltransferase involved in cell wall biosynthesis|nr:glycosyltransferase [Gemmatimonadota bacterium]MBK7784287.1 glycosyltransferase [Gemmatimonadota bacterium]MBP6669902.1 glycosyltransferase [Gemmatimonadales bacterium]MBP9199789.1 glycosyltransferase [Gemmatimonadales bacterium]
MPALLPRVLHALAPGPAGGLESVVQMHARGWVARGGEAAVALVLDEGADLPEPFGALAEAGVRVFCHPVPHRAYLREQAQYRSVLATWRPDVVHCHGYRADLIAGRAARTAGIARVSTVHGFTGGDWKNRLYERLQLRSFRRFSGVVAVSRPIAARLVSTGVPRDRVHLIPNAWAPGLPPLARAEARVRLGVGPADRLIGWVGRLSREKAADVLLEALARVEQVAVVVGDGGERDALRQQAGALGVAGRVRWAGLVPEAGRYFSAFDCYVLSSRTEGTPIALFEAMAAGVPIVTTRVGGVPDVVGTAEALLVPPEDPAALASAIDAVFTDPGAAAARAARAAARLADQYALEPWLERHAELYRAVMARRPGDLACT